jgi:inorganic pyrophosphatase
VSKLPQTQGFWQTLSAWVTSGHIEIDRPKGSAHPHYPAMRYPLDYGYLRGVRADDGDNLDVWVGSQVARAIVAIVCTLDDVKRDAEIKALLGCTEEEMQIVLSFHNQDGQRAILVRRPVRE